MCICLICAMQNAIYKDALIDYSESADYQRKGHKIPKFCQIWLEKAKPHTPLFILYLSFFVCASCRQVWQSEFSSPHSPRHVPNLLIIPYTNNQSY